MQEWSWGDHDQHKQIANLNRQPISTMQYTCIQTSWTSIDVWPLKWCVKFVNFLYLIAKTRIGKDTLEHSTLPWKQVWEPIRAGSDYRDGPPNGSWKASVANSECPAHVAVRPQNNALPSNHTQLNASITTLKDSKLLHSQISKMRISFCPLKLLHYAC